MSSFWDREAATFDDEVDHGLSDPLVREAWRRLLRSLLPDSPADVADIGCGTGSLSVLLATDGYRVVGIDVSDKMLRVASRKAEAAQVTLGLLRGDAARPPLDRSSMDVVLVRHVCWALQRPEAAVKRWATLLRERGRLVLIEGRWSTGAGISADNLSRIAHRVTPRVEVKALTDAALWGEPLADERYVLIAYAQPPEPGTHL